MGMIVVEKGGFAKRDSSNFAKWRFRKSGRVVEGRKGKSGRSVGNDSRLGREGLTCISVMICSLQFFLVVKSEVVELALALKLAPSGR